MLSCIESKTYETYEDTFSNRRNITFDDDNIWSCRNRHCVDFGRNWSHPVIDFLKHSDRVTTNHITNVQLCTIYSVFSVLVGLLCWVSFLCSSALCFWCVWRRPFRRHTAFGRRCNRNLLRVYRIIRFESAYRDDLRNVSAGVSCVFAIETYVAIKHICSFATWTYGKIPCFSTYENVDFVDSSEHKKYAAELCLVTSFLRHLTTSKTVDQVTGIWSYLDKYAATV